MNSQQEQDFSRFERLLSHWSGAYQCALVSYIGLETIQGPRLLFGRILLEATRSGVVETPFRFETEHIVAERFVVDATPSNVSSFLEHARNGEIMTMDGKTTISIQVDNGLSTFFSPIYHPLVTDGPRLPSLRISGAPKHQLSMSDTDLGKLDWEVKAAEMPFDNLDELLSHCNLPMQIQMGDMSTLEIVARSPVFITDTSRIAGNKATIECRLAATLDVEKLRLGYKIFRKDSVERNSVAGSSLDWRQDGGVQIGTYRMSLGNASLLQAFVSYAGISHHQWWITDPEKRLNPRLSIHQIFDEDLELLRGMLLKPDIDKPYAFENAVSTLLNLLGFAVSNYGRIPKLQKGPDIIATSPIGHIAVIECTVGLLDANGKLAKLVQRTKLIRDKLNETGYRFLQLQPVIVTSMSREEVAADLETAAKHGIAVVCKENIEEMLKQVNLPPNADRLFESAKGLVPAVAQPSLFNNNT